MSSLVKIRIAIVAAMEREVRPFIRSWNVRMIEHGGRRYLLFENGETALICGGIGAEAARRATEAIIGEVQPECVVSAGFAGALDDTLKVGRVFEPRTVINAADGARIEVPTGEGVLVTSSVMAGKEQKIRLAKAYGAHAVDMEAAAVAQGAQARGVGFAAVKAISDAADFDLPAMDRFVTSDGSFQSLRFLGYVALRPWLWTGTMGLARNSSKASEALCDALARYVSQANLVRKTDPGESFAAALNPNNVPPKSASGHTYAAVEVHTKQTHQG
jgi:adenosylhomocysteine nucleosidase